MGWDGMGWMILEEAGLDKDGIRRADSRQLEHLLALGQETRGWVALRVSFWGLRECTALLRCFGSAHHLFLSVDLLYEFPCLRYVYGPVLLVEDAWGGR